ncbi:TPA: aromatic ring-hydroxylating dioxygenase subunit alpha [Klebsiella pneumoniae]|nr:aromatic ring-hydroxylating dioxygenase subunit alpha [Klebsiella pneumoniae]HBQ2314530.1 aromatic ring-hydroxylating dioxygenase subunit alpha [Klebsiella variicola]HBR4785227.1 aromatic ring-hydroxylating dioxygenase subunit alpha [Klebsiella pneumoniae]HBV0869463.1 aromatic ring-hydroxylating dioxygenase subunit alpha [Klebsiella pneumoniae]HBY1570373.1 aromatic ring-hydroxylating dioxygenase subunit alpha [Klebsiella pneumoniae]
MFKENSFVIDDWHPVGAIADAIEGKTYKTKVLGTSIWYKLTNEGLSAGLTGQSTPLKTQSTYGLMWVSLSDTPREVISIPEFAELDRRVVSAGSIRVGTSGLRVVENFLDMAHFPFVHTDILGAEPLTEVAAYDVEIDDNADEILAVNCRFPQPKGSAAASEPVDMQYVYRIARPFIAILYKTCVIDPNRLDVLGLFVQPVDEESCIAHTIMCYLDDINTDKQLRDFQQRIFGQDIMILVNQVPKSLPLDPKHESPVRADALSSAYRRWIKERNVTFGTART